MASDWDRELEDLSTAPARPRRRSRWLLAIPVVLLAVAAIVYFGFVAGNDHKTKKRPVAPHLSNPERASCAQIDFGNRRFPKALPAYNLQTTTALANQYLDTGSNQRIIKTGFSLMLLSICNKTRDPTYRPEDQARSLANRARDLSVQSQADFAQTLITLAGTEARGKEQLTADTSFVQEASSICNQAAPPIKPLLHKLADPTGAFKSPDAQRLSPILGDLITKLQQLSDRSRAANARSFTSDFASRVRAIDRQATRLGKLNDHWKKNAQRAAFVANGIAQKELDFARTTEQVRDCGTIFGPA